MVISDPDVLSPFFLLNSEATVLIWVLKNFKEIRNLGISSNLKGYQ